MSRPLGARPSWALSQPVTIRTMTTAANAIAIRTEAGGNRMATSGNSAPALKARADELAAAHGLASSFASSPSSKPR